MAKSKSTSKARRMILMVRGWFSSYLMRDDLRKAKMPAKSDEEHGQEPQHLWKIWWNGGGGDNRWMMLGLLSWNCFVSSWPWHINYSLLPIISWIQEECLPFFTNLQKPELTILLNRIPSFKQMKLINEWCLNSLWDRKCQTHLERKKRIKAEKIEIKIKLFEGQWARRTWTDISYETKECAVLKICTSLPNNNHPWN